MVIWDFNVIVALGVTLGLGLVITAWMFSSLNTGPEGISGNRDTFRQCVFCGYLYFDYFKKTPCCCPRCGSYQN